MAERPGGKPVMLTPSARTIQYQYSTRQPLYLNAQNRVVGES